MRLEALKDFFFQPNFTQAPVTMGRGEEERVARISVQTAPANDQQSPNKGLSTKKPHAIGISGQQENSPSVTTGFVEEDAIMEEALVEQDLEDSDPDDANSLDTSYDPPTQDSG